MKEYNRKEYLATSKEISDLEDGEIAVYRLEDIRKKTTKVILEDN